MAIRNPLTPIALALATLACQAQDAGNTQRITITGRTSSTTPDLAGFGSNLEALATPLAESKKFPADVVESRCATTERARSPT